MKKKTIRCFGKIQHPVQFLGLIVLTFDWNISFENVKQIYGKA